MDLFYLLLQITDGGGRDNTGHLQTTIKSSSAGVAMTTTMVTGAAPGPMGETGNSRVTQGTGINLDSYG